jgi:hypothetical protein
MPAYGSKTGGDLISLSKRLGHATPQVTMYTYADDPRLTFIK